MRCVFFYMTGVPRSDSKSRNCSYSSTMTITFSAVIFFLMLIMAAVVSVLLFLLLR